MEPTEIISIILAIICFIVIFFIGIRTNLLREPKIGAIQKKRPLSFSRFQLWLWMLVIIPAFALSWPSQDNIKDKETDENQQTEQGKEKESDKTGGFPIIPAEYLLLLGIPAGVTLTSGVINSANASADEKKGQGKFDLKAMQPSGSIWSDLLMDDSAQFSVTRLQNFVFTISYVVIFASLFFENNMNFPDFPNQETAYVLMGISSVTYLLGKGLRK